jgi:hypothetical protein
MNNWETFTPSQDFGKITKQTEIKTFDNKVHNVSDIVGVAILNKKKEPIEYKEIGWFRQKPDFKRFIKLQKHNETLAEYDFEKLDEFEFAIWDTYSEQEDRDKIAKLFKKLKLHIEKAQNIILTESRNYL